ncbi:hypothetical protein Tco_0200255 [Tanacetum coccineum]
MGSRTNSPSQPPAPPPAPTRPEIVRLERLKQYGASKEEQYICHLITTNNRLYKEIERLYKEIGIITKRIEHNNEVIEKYRLDNKKPK